MLEILKYMIANLKPKTEPKADAALLCEPKMAPRAIDKLPHELCGNHIQRRRTLPNLINRQNDNKKKKNLMENYDRHKSTATQQPYNDMMPRH